MYALVFLTAYLETTCPAEVAKLIEKKRGAKLYLNAVVMNIFNMLVLGTLTYVFVVEHLCQTHPLTIFEQTRGVFGVVVIENFLFFLVHTVRTVPYTWKWMFPACAIFSFTCPLLIATGVSQSKGFTLDTFLSSLVQ